MYFLNPNQEQFTLSLSLSVRASRMAGDAHLMPPPSKTIKITPQSITIYAFIVVIYYTWSRGTKKFPMKYTVVNKWSQDDGLINRKYPPRSHRPQPDLHAREAPDWHVALWANLAKICLGDPKPVRAFNPRFKAFVWKWRASSTWTEAEKGRRSVFEARECGD